MNSTSELAKQLVITEQKLKEVYHIHNVILTDQQKSSKSPYPKTNTQFL